MCTLVTPMDIPGYAPGGRRYDGSFPRPNLGPQPARIDELGRLRAELAAAWEREDNLLWALGQIADVAAGIRDEVAGRYDGDLDKPPEQRLQRIDRRAAVIEDAARHDNAYARATGEDPRRCLVARHRALQ